MKRLTIKNSDGTYSQATDTTFEKIFNKCAEFEDFMEKFGCINLKELECLFGYYENNNYINKIEFITYQNGYKKYKNENLKLKNNWKELKKWIIDTKPIIMGSAVVFFKEALLDKMEELEKDD